MAGVKKGNMRVNPGPAGAEVVVLFVVRKEKENSKSVRGLKVCSDVHNEAQGEGPTMLHDVRIRSDRRSESASVLSATKNDRLLARTEHGR